MGKHGRAAIFLITPPFANVACLCRCGHSDHGSLWVLSHCFCIHRATLIQTFCTQLCACDHHSLFSLSSLLFAAANIVDITLKLRALCYLQRAMLAQASVSLLSFALAHVLSLALFAVQRAMGSSHSLCSTAHTQSTKRRTLNSFSGLSNEESESLFPRVRTWDNGGTRRRGRQALLVALTLE